MSARPAPAPPADHLRLFFALWPPAATRAALATAGEALRFAAPAAPVARENYHLTIAFIGTVPLAALERVRRIGERQRAAACSMEFNAYEYWPKPEVIVVAARTIDPPLESLWGALHRRARRRADSSCAPKSCGPTSRCGAM